MMLLQSLRRKSSLAAERRGDRIAHPRDIGPPFLEIRAKSMLRVSKTRQTGAKLHIS